jgi:hypothetical protein
MKKTLTFLLLSTICFHITRGQKAVPQGKMIAEIFTDFHYNIDDTTKTTGFGISRAYFGYNYQPGGNLSGTVILNVGSPDELLPGATHRRYAYFREASLTFTRDRFDITFGITGTHLFDFQQKFWGKRYVANTYQALNGYGFIADLGVAVNYKFSDYFRTEFTLMNGEGYSELQLDNGLKASTGLIITPDNKWAVKVYGDVENVKGKFRYTLISFAGFKNDLVTIGGEVSYKSNLDLKEGHDGWGLSGTGSIKVAKNMEIFSRYDYSTSIRLPGDNLEWNYLKDGSFFVLGVQHSFSQDVKIALDYQGVNPYNPGNKSTDMIYVNALFRF